LTAGYREFEFDLPGALLIHLVACLDNLDPALLNVGGLARVPEAQGVYQLFLDNLLVYIGKTDAEAGLQKRLYRHSQKVLHRRNLHPEQITFKAVRIFVFTAIDLEAQLIRHYSSGKTAWNGSGFGANDPGRNRDRSQPGRFHVDFPIDIDRPLEATFAGVHTAAQIVIRLKEVLPYDFRFALSRNSRRPHPDLETAEVTISREATTARAVMTELTRQLPPGWQATALAAQLILYPETTDDYPKAMVLARS
jgi:hypothetical protein